VELRLRGAGKRRGGGAGKIIHDRVSSAASRFLAEHGRSHAHAKSECRWDRAGTSYVPRLLNRTTNTPHFHTIYCFITVYYCQLRRTYCIALRSLQCVQNAGVSSVKLFRIARPRPTCLRRIDRPPQCTHLSRIDLTE
jgi:hypothetical protein